MADKKIATMTVAGAKRVLNVRADPPDIRDRMYEPALVQLKSRIDKRVSALILDQGTEGACTGFGLAAVINLLNKARGNAAFRASPRMLYEMAKKHDEWPGEDYAGSSCRGAIRGWRNMGVCSWGDWPYKSDKPGALTIDRAIAARENTVGAYYRLRPEISDYHAALNEVDAIYVSAQVHDGWMAPKAPKKGQLAVIKADGAPAGGHAFAIVGYDNDGFIVQNSWSKSWGAQGFARWLYEDWCENIRDGWVFRMALPTPRIFGLTSPATATGDVEARRRAPKRLEIAGHFVHFDDGKYKERGDYWSTREDIEQTAQRLAGAENARYKHLLVYAHGGLNSPDASARRVHALKDGFRRNGIYPFHVMYDTGIAEEIKDVVGRALSPAEKRAEGFVDWIAEKVTERTDTLIEDAVRKPVTPLWGEMKRDARVPFEAKGDGVHVIKTFAQALAGTGKSIHLAGHSTGGVLLGHLLDALDSLGIPDLVSTCSLMAPACTVKFYNEHYRPRLGAAATGGKVVRLPRLDVYNLTDALELDDNVVKAYRKSLLYLVSRALERDRNKPLLGMQAYSKKLAAPGLRFVYSNGKTGRTRSTSHGGFDNDIDTLNAIMATVLGHKAPHEFTKEEMEGY